jgi:hypothetical protein
MTEGRGGGWEGRGLQSKFCLVRQLKKLTVLRASYATCKVSKSAYDCLARQPKD